ncbi:hypothetical protein GE253_15450 [Niveispirillum sp. SYP-B3756]|uniref:energy transducer TonB n=1 Tax=Niveispirillum sp. SYP-B3756 TaxID=2662178 RepID=UPI0012920023|nr:energy transducer TonB [Niveispirillum sp. SYP-B3756]MQP66730.1 hypothetical protein [Niveispirillum sp. SYP-B3756]
MRTLLLFNTILTIFLLSPPTVMAQTAPTASHEYIDIGKNVCKDIQFPKNERENIGEGWVIFRATLQKDGKLTDLQVIAKTGNEDFVKTALRNFSKCRYPPPISENGEPFLINNIYFHNLFVRPDLQKNHESNKNKLYY